MHSTTSNSAKAIVSYVPALHAGYLSFFGKHPETPIFVLGRTFIDAYPRLNRDIRALDPANAAKALSALGFSASVLDVNGTDELQSYRSIVIPDEDVTRDFAEKYLSPEKTVRENIFLRWDGVFAGKEAPVSPDRTISDSALDRELMDAARTEGEKSADWWRQIGAVLVKDGAVVALGHTRYFPSDLALDIFGTPRITVDAGERPDLYISMHAEADLVAQAAHMGIPLEGASLYVSTFPCITCAFLIARSGIKSVYYDEGYSRIDAEGVLKGAGVEIVQVGRAS
jgi:dCMP deaminase